jgi:hypothetical protein
MARRRSARHSQVPTDAHLDDLLRFEEAARSLPTEEPARPWVAISAIQAFLLSAVAYTVARAFNFAPPYPLLLGVSLGAVLVRQAVVAVREPDWARAREAVRAGGPVRRIDPGGWYANSDGMLNGIRRWDRRLDWGVGEPERFASTVVVRVRELADERLRHGHGITIDRDPVRARALLGEQAWALLAGRTTRVATPAELSAVVARLETL